MADIKVTYTCPDCGTQYPSRGEAIECCKLAREVLERQEKEDPPCCAYCDLPAEWDYEFDGYHHWVQDCDCHMDGRYHFDEIRVTDKELSYEMLQRFRGTEVLPWEYPQYKEGAE